MKSVSNPLRPFVAALFAALSLSAAAHAQATRQAAQQVTQQLNSASAVRIKNFGRMDERFYRGAEPRKLEDFRALKEIGITTVIDLQEKPAPEERGWVESLGMRYVNIPMVEKKYPRPEWVAAFMKTVDDPATGKFFVHCAGGRHRTGSMGAVYRFEKYGWDYDQVYAEMKTFDFYTRWGHGDFKTFVQDYWRDFQTRRAATSAQTPAAAARAGAGAKR